MNRYKISKKFILLNDRESVKFHVKKEDYFGTIATILSLIEQDLELGKKKNIKELEKIKISLKNLEKDFIFLQNNYNIKKKSILNQE